MTLSKQVLVLPVWQIFHPFLMAIGEVMQRDGRFLKHCHILHQVLHSNKGSGLKAKVEKMQRYSVFEFEQSI